jgi:hypothetical protein
VADVKTGRKLWEGAEEKLRQAGVLL